MKHSSRQTRWNMLLLWLGVALAGTLGLGWATRHEWVTHSEEMRWPTPQVQTHTPTPTGTAGWWGSVLPTASPTLTLTLTPPLTPIP